MDSPYLKDFRERIKNNDYPGFLKIWEEYCYGDQPDGKEMIAILESVKNSDLATSFGLHVERLLPLWRELKDEKEIHDVIKLIFDLETTNSDQLADLAIEYLKNHYPEDPLFQEKLRLVGLRNREKFQGAIRNFELLTHFKKGNFVYHTAGLGTGEIIDVSLVREEVTLECECVLGAQHLSFEKAFKTLMVIPHSHFYARRFGNPDLLEKEAKEDPAEVVRNILEDLGPKTAAELKDELCDVVIPADIWARWWQTARAKLKKDTRVESPKELKDPFKLRKKEVSHETLFYQSLEAKPEVQATIQLTYAFLRDFPEVLRNKEFQSSLRERLQKIFSQESLSDHQKISLLFFLEDLHAEGAKALLQKEIQELTQVPEVIVKIEILPFQKRALQLVKALRSDFTSVALEVLFTANQNLLRDYLLQELNTSSMKEALEKKLETLLVHPLSFAEVFIWYFQKVIEKNATVPFSDPKGQNRFFEGLLVLLDHLSRKIQYRDLVKKILSLITGDRYKLVRDIMAQSNFDEVKEYLLLATKCEALTDHDIKILQSLGEVVHPSLSRLRKDKEAGSQDDEHLIWTTQEGYQKLQERIQQIATVETVQNAKEIEVARSHGDLRENAEFKAALERRDRLQAELKLLSDQIAKARVLSSEDVVVDEAGVGTIVHCKDSKGKVTSYTLLGPWDADPDRQILSFQSKFAQAMKGKGVGQSFSFQGETFTITEIINYFDKK